MIYKKQIVFAGTPAVIACDKKCNKAWGCSLRPRLVLSDNEDDFCYFSDRELGQAPANPGSSEGGDIKPADKVFNKWCARQCERSVIVEPGQAVELPDFEERFFNMPNRQ